MGVPYSDAALKTELTSDPASLGYAARIAAHDLDGLRALISATTYGWAYLPIAASAVLKWGAAAGVRYNIEAAALATGAYASGQAHAITPAAQAIALAVRDLLVSGIGLDLTDPAIVGAVAGGAAYTPGGTVATPGMLDALVSAAVLVDGSGDSLKDSLIDVGKTAASRATVLWGYSYSTNPSGPTAVVVTAEQVAAALRS